MQLSKGNISSQNVRVPLDLLPLVEYNKRMLEAANHFRPTCSFDQSMQQKEVQAKLHLDFGEKGFDWKYSKKTIPIYMPEAELVIRPGFQHCGYMAAHPKEDAEEIEAFIRRNRNVLG